MTPEALWNRYAKIWTSSANVRTGELKACLDDDATYCDPNGLIEGSRALSAYMGEFQQHAAGATFRILEVMHHNNRTLAHWVLEGPDGRTVQSGTSFGQLSRDGRLLSITGFFDVLGSAGAS